MVMRLEMQESAHGDYVDYTDYLELERECESLRRTIDDLKTAVENACDEWAGYVESDTAPQSLVSYVLAAMEEVK